MISAVCVTFLLASSDFLYITLHPVTLCLNFATSCYAGSHDTCIVGNIVDACDLQVTPSVPVRAPTDLLLCTRL